jgi:tetratricopeptide (TPR) repeat protein
MRLVALSWARIGWAKYKHGENLPAMQFLTSAWLLSQSATVANRLAQVLEKQGQAAKAEHMYASAIAADDNDKDENVRNSRAQLLKLIGDSAKAEKEVSRAREDLAQGISVKLDRGSTTSTTTSARFNFVFDGSPRPERVEFAGGDESLRPAAAQLKEKDFPVRFPDVSSIKIVRQASLNCTASGCNVVLMPIEK